VVRSMWEHGNGTISHLELNHLRKISLEVQGIVLIPEVPRHTIITSLLGRKAESWSLPKSPAQPSG
jgi:hypothetical protein